MKKSNVIQPNLYLQGLVAIAPWEGTSDFYRESTLATLAMLPSALT